MTQKHSFTAYIADRFYNELFNAVQDYMSEDLETHDLNLFKVRNIECLELVDIDVKFVSVNDLPEMAIEFEVVVEAEFEARESDYHYDETESCQQWLMIQCKGNIDKNLDDFEICYPIQLYNGKNKQPHPMSDALVPIIQKDNLDNVAEDFLRRNYPKALFGSCYVDPLELASNMGITVKVTHITKEASVFGRCYFNECETELYDPNTSTTYRETIPSKTILVDKNVAFLRNLGALNNTIIHECVHWDMHRKAFALARLYDNSLSNIGCQVVGGVTGNNRDTVDWMEWQANALAPRIQMPITMFKKKVEQLISKYCREMKAYDMIDIIEPVIDDLAITFGVSRLAAKIRMLDAGYEEASGAFIYIDNHYVKPHKTHLDKNKTFSISVLDAIVESKLNLELASVLANNEYIFVDSHFILNTPLYLETDKCGRLALTHYARNHMDECCLVFDLKIRTSVSERYHTECFLNRDKSSDITFEAHYYEKSNNANNQIQMIKDYNADVLSIAKKLPMSFSGSLDALIGWAEMTEEELAESADMSEKTIQRLRNVEPDNVTIETVIQLCIGMKLPPVLSMCLLKASGKSFMATEQHIMYQFLLNCCYHMSIFDCNEMLTAQGLKPLGRQNRGS